jgi:hypothetical protein
MAEKNIFDYSAAIRDFEAKLNDCTTRAICGRTYIRTAKFTKWLRSKIGPGSITTQATRLLHAAYHHRIQPGLPISSEQISAGEHGCLLVFSILLELHLGHLVHHFQRQDIVDKHLPIDLRSLQAKIWLMDREDLPNAESLPERFEKAQWRYCPAIFDLGVGWDHPRNKIIPICKKEQINDKGGTARLWQIAVQKEFVGHRLREAVSNSMFHDTKNNLGEVSLIQDSSLLILLNLRAGLQTKSY